MIRGRSFYAFWDEVNGFWSKDENHIQEVVDNAIQEYIAEKQLTHVDVRFLENFSSNKWNEWQKYCKSLPDNFHELDSTIAFSNDKILKTDYMTRTLPYPLKSGKIDAYNQLMDTLYDTSERQKLEWAIGAIISGESKNIQKFMVLYGGPGTGKSTVLNIIQDMFPGYYGTFESKALGNANNVFALESFKDNPLIAIDHEGDLSRIEDNTKLNAIVSHDKISVNEKFKPTYSNRFNSFLFIGTNKPVRITDSKSGIIRRLIDVIPSGRRLPKSEYDILLKKITFEYPGIAYHCYQVFKELGANYYNDYIPTSMMEQTNNFYNFIEDNYDLFSDLNEEDGLSLSTAWTRYKEYCDEARVPYPMSKMVFKNELMNYFAEFKDRHNGHRSVYIGFLHDKFRYKSSTPEEVAAEGPSDENGFEIPEWLEMEERESILDEVLKDYPAQYAKTGGTPNVSWIKVKTRLSSLDTTKLHYVQVPEKLIVIDFDLKDENGEKSGKLNLEAASRWPQTYSEFSKSGCGIHLHYWYDGDPKELSRVFDENIEIKVYTGNSSLRRMLSKCNGIPIAHISSGLPLKERSSSVLKVTTIQSEKGLRDLIGRNLRKEIHANTKPSMDFINTILNQAYDSGLKYDVTDMRSAIQKFAMNSTHNADYCMTLMCKMKFKSEEPSENEEKYKEDVPIVFFDVEVFPNLFVVCFKRMGEGNPIISLINPKPEDVEELTKFKLVGFNNRRYDNHILYARIMGYSEKQLYNLSQRIIVDQDKDAFFGEAYNLSYTDIYDYMSAQNKMSLKKWEIKLHILHKECRFRWDEEVPKEFWEEVADYCKNDVFATEKVWEATQDDFLARMILAEWAGMTVNDTTNSLTTRIIIGKDRNPWDKFIYTDLSTIFPGYEFNPYGIDPNRYDKDAKIVKGKSIYKGKDPGEGGYVLGNPGIYYMVAVLDVASMHPHSAIRLKIFGEMYTKRLEAIVEGRVAIKHGDVELAKALLPKELHKYLNDQSGWAKVADALKTAINSVYGLTSAGFPNKLRDPRNKDNIVAKYGALFMINLEEEVTKRGYQVVHIKTDSIKIANATPEIIQFVMNYGKEYGYTFEHEATYDRICLVNDAVYIAKYASEETCNNLYGYVPGKNKKHPLEWTATGTQFQIPYVFKTLFSKEKLEFWDLCETKSVSTCMYLDFNESLCLPFDENRNTIENDDPPSCHDRRFVGKVGLFCPVVSGVGGGLLLREAGDNKFSAVTGTKKPGKGDEAYRWMESDMVQSLELEDKIDRSYYNHLVDEAVETISEYGDFEMFVSDEKRFIDFVKVPDGFSEEEVPFDRYMNHPMVA